MNTSRSSTTHFMPYEVTYNKKPNIGQKKTFQQLDKHDKPVDLQDDELAIPEIE